MRLAKLTGTVAAVIIIACGCSSIRPPYGAKPVDRRLTVTAYCNCGECCEWHRNWLLRPVYSTGPSKGKLKKVGYSASGTKTRPGTIAADTSIYPFGTIMYIEGYGYGRVEDRGGAIKGQHIDLWMTSHRKAQKWGRQTKVVRVWFEPR